MEKPKIVTPIYWKIIINRGNDGTATMEYEDHYDRNNDDHVEAYNNMKTYKSGFENILGTCLEFSEEDEKLKIKYILTGPFVKIANAVSMEFLGLGSLGQATILDIIGTMGASIIKKDEIDKENKLCTDNYIR